jgi:hypothetical protein
VEWPLPGVVRLGARWYDSSGALVRESDWGALPGPMWPGDTGLVNLRVEPTDGAGGPLPPGRYTLGLELFQAGFEWFGDEGDEPLRLDVDVG